ncbi:MAG: PDZ domain-containing protein [Planctomycetota bacterium]|jgi:poly(3-hydroxybutyrate) depolymerase
MRTAVLLACFAIVPVRADDALSRLRTAPAADVDEVVKAILDTAPDRAEIAARLAKPFAVPPLEPGWHEHEVIDAKGVKRPFEFYVPKSIADKTEPVPLLVHMHGGVGRADYFPNPGRRSTGGRWITSAESEGFVVAFPYGRSDCMWWSEAGIANVRAVIREVKRCAPIDDDAILGTGFSDGGSGAYYLAMAAPDPFAGFLPLNGHFAVASGASGHDLYLQNLVRTPLFIAQTQDDPLYPAASLLPHVRAAMSVGALIHLVSYPRGGHSPAYFAEQRGPMARFITDTSRDPLPRRVRWRCATPALGRVDWVEITSIGKSENDPAATEDLNVMSTPGRVRIGFNVDRAFAGPGVRIAQISKGTLAEKLGLTGGDVLVAMDGKDLKDLGTLRALLNGKRYGDAVRLRVRTGEEERDVDGRFPAFVPRPVYRRAGPTAEFDLQSEGNRIVVRCRNVRQFRLWLSPVLFGDGEIALAVNGKRTRPAVKAIPLEGILRRYASDADAGRVFTRVVVVDVP